MKPWIPYLFGFIGSWTLAYIITFIATVAYFDGHDFIAAALIAPALTLGFIGEGCRKECLKILKPAKVDVEVDPDTLDVYVRLSPGSIANTKEVIPGSPFVLIDYDAAGNVVGVEVIQRRRASK